MRATGHSRRLLIWLIVANEIRGLLMAGPVLLMIFRSWHS